MTWTYLTNGNDNVSFDRALAGVTVHGMNGDDLIVGSNFNDVINGGRGNDRLNGGGGNDGLDGGEGNDQLNGGAGADRLRGGAGNDTFIFQKGQVTQATIDGAPLDHIVDFTGAGGWQAGENDFIRFQGFGAGSTLTKVGAATSHTNAFIFKITDGVDLSEHLVLIQFTGAITDLLAPGSSGADYGWL